MSEPAELRNVGDGEGGVGNGLEVQDFGLALYDGIVDGGEILEIDKGGGDVAGPREEVGQEGMGATVEVPRSHHVSTAAAQLQQHRRDGGHPTRGAVGGLGAFKGRHLTAEIQHGGIEVTAVDEEVAIRAEFAGEHAPHGLGFDHGESGRGLDGHVDPTMLPELVASAC